MARIVVTGIAGELRGKLGGNVFARNKAGAYVRANAIGTNPNTDAQIRARTAFATASSQYHSLTDAQKIGWQNFATNEFVPKSGTVPGTLSGFNAWVSTRSVVENATEMTHTLTTININGTGAVVTTSPYQYNQNAPISMLQSGLVDVNGVAFGVQITDATATSSESSFSSAEITLNASGVSTAPEILDFKGPITGGSTPVGFALYMSRGMGQAQMFVENEEEYLVSYLESPSFATNKPFINCKLPFTLEQSSTKYQQLPQPNTYIRLTLYSVSLSGMMTKIGAKVTQIQ